MYIIIIILLIILILFLYNDIYDKFTNINLNEIPFVIICWNNLTFVKKFVNQIKKFKKKIIILNNNSDYEPLYIYFEEIKKELGDQIEIRLLDKNYGHEVYIKLAHTLPDVYILSDPDLELNQNLPDNFIEILYDLSNKYKIYKVGFALDISDHDKFLSCDKYTKNQNIYNWELQYWNRRIDNKDYEIYDAEIDTTFCLINNKYFNNNYISAIRIA